MSASGDITGTSKTLGTSTFTVQVADSSTPALTATSQLSIVVAPATPVVTAISPTWGPAAGGTVVTITGVHLSGATAIDFGTAAATHISCSATSCTATSPPGSAGPVDVMVTTAGGTSSAYRADHFTYISKPPPSGAGYWMLASNGTLYPFGSAAQLGSATCGTAVALAPTPDGAGLWVACSNGVVQAFGDATSLTPSTKPQARVATIASTADGKGYWLATSSGEIITAGDAGYYGSPAGSGINLNAPIINMASTADGKGYWLLGGDGRIFAYGVAPYFGTPNQINPSLPPGGSNSVAPFNNPPVAIAATPDDRGYWVVASDGGVFSFGDAGFFGSMGAVTLNKPVVGMVATFDGKGYWIVASDGGVFAFGDAPFIGSLGGQSIPAPIVGFAGW